MDRRTLGRTGLPVTPIGFGAFKIGRNQKIKYPQGYELPDEAQAAQLLNEVLNCGINLIDTAPAYGISEERIGKAISHRRKEFFLSTKVGETFVDGQSHYDFSEAGVRSSIERSLRLLRTDVLDIVLIHSNGDDLHILNETDAPKTLADLQAKGVIRAIGFSGKTPQGAQHALSWADVLMVEYHQQDQSHQQVMQQAREDNVGVLVKKGLASGTLGAEQAIRFVLANPAVGSMVIGGKNIEHIRRNIEIAENCS